MEKPTESEVLSRMHAMARDLVKLLEAARDKRDDDISSGIIWTCEDLVADARHLWECERQRHKRLAAENENR
jgi:hypothetical protein